MDDVSVRRAAQFVSILSGFIVPFMGSSVVVAIPSMAEDLKMSVVIQSWVPASYLLAVAAFLLPCGKIADIYGRKRVFVWGSGLYAVSSLVCAVAPVWWVIIVGRVAQGISSSMIFGTGIAILTSIFPPGERGRVLGINTASVYVGLSCGPFLGGLLTQYAGWRSIFYISIPLGLLILVSAQWKLKGEWKGAPGERFDLSGSILYAFALVAFMFGLSLLPKASGIWLTVSGMAGLALFLAWESQVRSPLLDARVFVGNPVFVFSNLAALLNYSAIAAVIFLISLYLQNVKLLQPQQAGAILVSQPIVMAVCSPFTGKLSDRIEPRLLASIGMGLIVVALVIFSFLGLESSTGFVLTPLLVLGLGMGLFSSPNTNAVMGSVEKSRLGVASATLGTMRSLGQTLSMGIVMMVLSAYIGHAKISPENCPQFVASLHTAFPILAGLSLVGVFASLARGRMH